MKVTTFQERLAKAKAAPRPTKDVEIVLDAGLGEKIEELREELMMTQQEEAADQRLGRGFPKSDALQEELDGLLAEVADMIVTFRFTQMPAAEWAEIASRCPVRLDVPLDHQYGFNTDQAAVLGAPASGRRVEDGELYGLTEDEWRDLFDTISGAEIRRIADALFALNEYGPTKRLEDAKKVSAARRV